MGNNETKLCCTSNICGADQNELNSCQIASVNLSNQKNGVMSLSNKEKENDILVKHIKATSNLAIASKIYDTDAKIKLLKEAVQYAPVLRLKVINSGNLPKGTILVINAVGVENSLRNDQNGITYFGCKKRAFKSNDKQKQGDIINDVVIPSKDADTAERHRGRHFQIIYDLQKNCYKIKDLETGFGTFAKLDFPLALRDNHLLSMGESFLIVNLINEKKDGADYLRLRLKVFSGPSNGDVYYFNPVNEVLRIGRMNNCEVQIEDSLLSKYQAHITYNESNGWILVDGLNGKSSTNDEIEMFTGMIIKANQTLFHVSIDN